jgi:serine/threonine-protein kinase HipA
MPELDGHPENEHFCLSLARELGLPTARSRVEHFEDQVAIVVERYDRLRTPSGIVRIHQEDVCQALAVRPANKYENDGGPGVRAVVDLLREHSQAAEEDVETFVESLVFNWLIAGTDAHAKNYSLLLGARGRARLAPLYDVASALPYVGKQLPKLKLAMKIGGNYRLREIGLHQWGKLASEVKLTADHVEGVVRRMATALPDLAVDVLRRSRGEGLDHRALDLLAGALRERAQRCVA